MSISINDFEEIKTHVRALGRKDKPFTAGDISQRIKRRLSSDAVSEYLCFMAKNNLVRSDGKEHGTPIWIATAKGVRG